MPTTLLASRFLLIRSAFFAFILLVVSSKPKNARGRPGMIKTSGSTRYGTIPSLTPSFIKYIDPTLSHRQQANTALRFAMMHSNQPFHMPSAGGHFISSSSPCVSMGPTDDSKALRKGAPAAAASTVSSKKPKLPTCSSSSQGRKKEKKSKKEAPPTLVTKDGRIIEKPKRLRTAYNLFFQHHRELLLQSLPSRSHKKPRNSHGKIDFTKLARTIAARWKAVSEEEKAHFQELSSKDRARCEQEWKEWKELERAQRLEKHPVLPVSGKDDLDEEKAPAQELYIHHGSHRDLEMNERTKYEKTQNYLGHRTALPVFTKTQTQYPSVMRRKSLDLEPFPFHKMDFMQQQHMPAPMVSPFHEDVPPNSTGMPETSLEPLPFDPNQRLSTSLTDTGDLAHRLGNDCVAAMIRYFG
eukprot:scaffold1982_cov93-Amphora_coffeaeformis.AAC.37